MVKQYRSAAGRVMLEVPAGTLNPGEDPALCATRELKEETGYQAAKWEPLGYFFPSPGFSTERMYLYFAQQLTKAERSLDEDEDITVELIPLTKALDMIEKGSIIDAKTIIGLSRVWKRLSK
jgi:ADP-ribose pyrophosphatase